MKIPMREKYVDEAVGVWIIFGVHKDGTVDVADQCRDVFQAVQKETAEKLVALQEEFRQKLYDLLYKCPNCHGWHLTGQDSGDHFKVVKGKPVTS